VDAGAEARRPVRRPGEVEAEADHGGVADELAQDASRLLVVDEDVVRPLEEGGHAGHALDGLGGRHAGGEGDQPRRRSQEHGYEQPGSGGRLPRPAPPAAARGLVVGSHDDAVRRPCPGQVGDDPVGGVDVGEPADVGEAGREHAWAIIAGSCSPRS
jgi:hypothetical protein